MTTPLARNADGNYERGGIAYDGVSQVLGVALSKPGLPRWAANETAKAAAAWVRDAVDDVASPGADVAGVVAEIDAAQKEWAGAPWRSSMKAAHKGSAVHDIAARMAAGETVAPEAVPEAVAPHLGVLARFLREWHVRLLATEATVYHDRERYAGTLDMLARLYAPDELNQDARLTVVDFKTKPSADKARLYPENRLQNTAYARAQYYALPDGSTHPIKAKWGAVVLLWPEGYRVERFPITGADWAAWKAALALYRWHKAQNGGAK